MNIDECAAQLRILANANADYQLEFNEYRQQRKRLLDILDQNYNGVEPVQVSAPPQLPPIEEVAIVDPDKTQPYFASKISKCMSFLKKS